MALRPMSPHRSALAVLAATLAFMPSLATPAHAADCPNADLAPGTANLDQVRAAVICLHNAERAQRGIAPLKENRRLDRSARAHSVEMVQERYFAHASASGTSFAGRIVRAGYTRWSTDWTLGENLAWGTGSLDTPRAVETAWMRSSGHRSNLLDADFRDVGVGVSFGVPFGDAGRDGATYTVDFGVRR
jgi:uncharacterized protein YkwD